MSGFKQYSTPNSCSVVGTFGELQVTVSHEHVVVDLQSRNYDTIGRLHCEHALARLPLETAMRLRDLLDQAIEASRVTVATAQPALWSESNVECAAGELWQRLHA